MQSNFRNETQLKIDQALSDLKLQYESDRDKLISRQAAEMQDFVSGYDKDDFEKKKTDLLTRHQEDLSNLERQFLEDCDKLEASVTAELEAKHARDKIATKEKHYQVGSIGYVSVMI